MIYSTIINQYFTHYWNFSRHNTRNMQVYGEHREPSLDHCTNVRFKELKVINIEKTQWSVSLCDTSFFSDLQVPNPAVGNLVGNLIKLMRFYTSTTNIKTSTSIEKYNDFFKYCTLRGKS